MYLEKIVTVKKREVAAAKEKYPMSELIAQAERLPPGRPFQACLSGSRGAIIAEIKRRSPSRGELLAGADAVQIAQLYESNGAAAISVLTDGEFFGGSGGDLMTVRDSVSLPLLRKDFIVDPYQIYESRILGADCVLLIADILDEESLAGFIARASYMGMDCLVEAHSRFSLGRAVNAGATLIGINNRDLKTFDVNIETTLELLPFIPPGVPVVSESGITSRREIDILVAAGVNAVLIGEALMTSDDIGATLAILRGKAKCHDGD